MKLKPEMVISVTAECIGSAECPIKWIVSAMPRSASRTFESYGKEPEKHPYTIEKLPKAVQEFIGERKPKSFISEAGRLVQIFK